MGLWVFIAQYVFEFEVDWIDILAQIEEMSWEYTVVMFTPIFVFFILGLVACCRKIPINKKKERRSTPRHRVEASSCMRSPTLVHPHPPERYSYVALTFFPFFPCKLPRPCPVGSETGLKSWQKKTLRASPGPALARWGVI